MINLQEKMVGSCGTVLVSCLQYGKFFILFWGNYWYVPRNQLFWQNFTRSMEEVGDICYKISWSQPKTTVSFLMLARHFLFTFLALNFLCILQAQYKVYRYRSTKEIYRNSAIPHLQRWKNKRNIGHMQQMWGSLSNILQKIKVLDKFYWGFNCDFYFAI